LKSRQLSGLSLTVFEADPAKLAADWQARIGPDASAFEHEPVVIDLSQLARPAPSPTPEGEQAALPLEASAPIDLAAVVAMLKASHLQPVAVSGATPPELAAARALGLGEAETDMTRELPAREVVKEVVRELRVEVPVEVPGTAAPTLVIDKPLRSGQQVYAKGGDLVVLALVSHGAEVIADGSIHVYAPLRGKAIAGARGQAGARIFAYSMEAELISINGVYRTTENPLPADVLGKPAQVRLDEDEKLVFQPLHF
jgi:septum site-determining protein MinC